MSSESEASDDASTAEKRPEFTLGTLKRKGRPDAPLVVRFGKPKSLSLVYDIVGLMQANQRRAWFASLGLVWEASGAPRPPAQYARFGYDVGAYGGAVEDEMVKRGVPRAATMEAAVAACVWLCEQLPDETEVDAAEGFSEAGASDEADAGSTTT